MEIIPNRQLALSGSHHLSELFSGIAVFAARQMNVIGLTALIPTVIICKWAGLEGFWLIAGSLIAWFPVFIICDLIILRIVTPKLEAYGRGETEPYHSKTSLFR